jgi:hypothetical protein
MVANNKMVTGQGSCGRYRACSVQSKFQRLAVLLLLLALLYALPRAMAANAVDISVIVGFTDTFHPGRWTPLSVTVTNQGGDVSGELDVQVTGGDALRGRSFVTSHRRKVELQRASRKTLAFTVFPQSLFHPLVIRMHTGGRELARLEVDLRTRLVTHERLLLVLSRDANLDYLNDRGDNELRVLYPHPELLPVHWRGYDAVAAIVLHGVSLERLSARQFDALQKWIAQGGILAVSGGPDYALLRSPRLAALLPGVPLGMTRVDAGALQGAFATSLDVSRPVYINRLGTIRGHAHLRADAAALIVERALGLGRVLYLTFDVASHPFDRWDGMRKLWLDSLRLPPPKTASLSAVDSALEDPLPALIRAESADFPSYVFVLLFLAFYVGLLLAVYPRSERERQLRAIAPLWNWGAPALFALAAWLLFGPVVFPRGGSWIVVGVIEPLPDSPYARLDLDLGVYANRSGALRFEYRGAEPVLYPRPVQRGGDVGNWVFGEGPQPYLEPSDRRRYVLNALQGEDVIAFDLKASVYDETMGPRIVLDNASGRSVEDLRLVFDGYVYELGSVAAGGRSERRLTRRTHGIEAGKASWRDVLKPSTSTPSQILEPARIVLERRSKVAGENGYPGPGHALLVGYTASPLRPADASANWPRRERALVAFQVLALPHDASKREDK